MSQHEVKVGMSVYWVSIEETLPGEWTWCGGGLGGFGVSEADCLKKAHEALPAYSIHRETSSPCVVYARSNAVCSLGTKGCGSYHGR